MNPTKNRNDIIVMIFLEEMVLLFWIFHLNSPFYIWRPFVQTGRDVIPGS